MSNQSSTFTCVVNFTSFKWSIGELSLRALSWGCTWKAQIPCADLRVLQTCCKACSHLLKNKLGQSRGLCWPADANYMPRAGEIALAEAGQHRDLEGWQKGRSETWSSIFKQREGISSTGGLGPGGVQDWLWHLKLDPNPCPKQLYMGCLDMH